LQKEEDTGNSAVTGYFLINITAKVIKIIFFFANKGQQEANKAI
jgi:hypothetical protein